MIGRTSEEKKKCVGKCQKTQLIRNFYSADTLLFPMDGKFHICKACTEEIVNSRGYDGLIIILRAMNKPFISELYKDDWKDYLRQINSLPQYRSLTFDDSTLGDRSENSKKFSNSDEINDIDFNITPQMRVFWRGYDDTQIPILDTYFQDLIVVYESSTPIQKSLYRNMAIAQYKADISTTAREFNDYMSTLSKLMTDANIKPVQESGAVDNGLSTWGEWVKKIEETEPIPEPMEQWKDVDGIWKYISKWFVGHFAKVFGLTNDNQADVDMLLDSDGDKNGGV